jgi:uncharacterized protein (DUF433 family)
MSTPVLIPEQDLGNILRGNRGSVRSRIPIKRDASAAMLRNKPIRQPRQNIRRLPTYTIPEAASFLAIKPRTLLSWYEGNDPILKASAMHGSIHLLSYQDLEEAYRVHLLREKYGFSFQFLRKAMRNARKMFRSQHPLHRVDAVKECLEDLVYEKPRRGQNPRTITSLGQKPGQQFVKEVADLFAERIEPDTAIYPWRFAANDKSRPVSLSPHIMSGRLVVTGTRIPVQVLWGRKKAGEKADEIARDYGLDSHTVQQALAHIDIRQKAA